MNLAIIYPAPAIIKDNQVLVKEAFGRRVTGLGEYFDNIFLFLPIFHENKIECTYPIEKSNLKVFKLRSTSFLLSFLLILPSIRAFNKVKDLTDVVYIGFPSLIAFPLWIYALIHKKPTVIHVVSNILEVVKIRSGINKIGAIMLAWLLYRLSRIMASNSLVITNGSELLKMYSPIAASSLMIVTSSLLKSDLPVTVKKDTFNGKIKLLFVGKLNEGKGTIFLLQALEKLVNEFKSNVQLTVIGDGPLEDKLKKYVANHNLDHVVDFTGYIPPSKGLFEYFKNADLFVLPTLYEGTPRVVTEALALGLPVIATNIGGIPDIVIHNENGLLISPGNVDDIVNSVLKLSKEPELRQKMIKHGMKTAQEHSIDNQSEKIAKAISDFTIINSR